MNLKERLHVGEMPREKLQKFGVQTLSDQELVSILLGSGNSKKTVQDLAHELLQSANHCLNELGRFQFNELVNIQGMGPSKACSILAAYELGRRKRTRERSKKSPVNCSANAYELFQEHLADLIHEEVWVLMLSRSNVPLTMKKISEGGFSGTVIDPKKVFHLALQFKCSHIIIAHNHPSGNLIPSQEDIRVTEKLVACGRLLELQVLDHIIVTDNGYYSFADEGKI
jgi:DNA repair protein RadC